MKIVSKYQKQMEKHQKIKDFRLKREKSVKN